MENKKIFKKYNSLRNTITFKNQIKKILNEQGGSINSLDFFDENSSIYNGFIFENTSVAVGIIGKDFKRFKTGNLDDVYSELFSKVKKDDDLFTKLNIVYSIIISYFGYGDVKERIKYYFYNDNVTLESLKGKNLAVCLEDAVLSQNMLRLLLINSTLKVSLVQYDNGVYDTHAYNLISYNNKFYIFDSRFPSNNSPVIGQLSESEYSSFLLGEDETMNIKMGNNIIYYACNIPLKEINKDSSIKK